MNNYEYKHITPIKQEKRDTPFTLAAIIDNNSFNVSKIYLSDSMIQSVNETVK